MSPGPDAPPEQDVPPPAAEIRKGPGRAPAPAPPTGVSLASAGELTAKAPGALGFARHLHLPMAVAALALATYAVVGQQVDRDHRLPASPQDRRPAASLDLKGLTARLAELEGQVQSVRQQQAVSLLEGALARHQPFETELASALVLAADDERLLADLDRLGPLAARGVPTRRDLLDALPGLVGEARVASRQTGVIGGATVLMRDLALGLGVGELPEGSVERLLRQAERARELGQLEVAAANLRGLPAGMAGLAGWWLEGFAAREAAEQALGRLRQTVARGALAGGPA